MKPGPVSAEVVSATQVEYGLIDVQMPLLVDRALLILALKSARQSLILVAAVMIYVTYLGVQAGQLEAALAVACLGITIGFWRWVLARFVGDVAQANPKKIKLTALHLQANAALAGVLWAIATLFIYPALHGLDASAYLVLVLGSIAVGAVFMAPAWRAFESLLVGHVIALGITTARVAEPGAYGFGVLALLYCGLMYVACHGYRSTTISEIRNRITAERASALLLQRTQENERIRAERNERETLLLRQAREEASAAAQRAMNVKNIFVARCSHELRTPLQTIGSSCELLEHLVSTLGLSQAQRDALSVPVRRMNSASASLLWNASRLGDLVRAESGHMLGKPESTNLSVWGDDVTAADRMVATNKGIQFNLETSAVTVLVDREALRQIVSNLVGNAVKYTAFGSVTVSLSVGQSTSVQKTLQIHVNDTGMGMPSDSIEAMFEPWARGNANSAKERGWGIGLTIVREVVRLLQGRLDVKSRPSVGTTITVDLPVVVESNTPATRDVTRHHLSKLRGRVLLVDDDLDTRASIADLLRSLGLDCVDVESAHAALKVVRTTPFDYLITDIQMPFMDGYQLAEALQTDPPHPIHPRLIAMSAFSLDPAKRHLFSGFLAKPFRAAAIADLLIAGQPPDWIDSVR